VSDDEWKRPQALRTAQDNEWIAVVIFAIPWNPDRSIFSLIVCRSCSNQFSDDFQKLSSAFLAFRIKSVRHNTARNSTGGIRTTASHNQDAWEPASNYRQQFKPRHLRHVQIGKQYVGNCLLQGQKSVKAVDRG